MATIKPASFADFPLLARWSSQGAEHDYKLHLPAVRRVIARRYSVLQLMLAKWRYRRLILVAWQNGRPAGFLVASPNVDGVAVLQWIYVDPAFRSHGVAKQLLEALETLVKQRVHKIMLWTEVASDYYQKLGWQVEGELPRHWWGKDFKILVKYLK